MCQFPAGARLRRRDSENAESGVPGDRPMDQKRVIFQALARAGQRSKLFAAQEWHETVKRASPPLPESL